MTLTCERCGTAFPAVSRRARYCSGVCRAAASRARAGGRPVALVVPAADAVPDGPVAVQLERWLVDRRIVEDDDHLVTAARRLAQAIDDAHQTPAALVSCTRALLEMLPDLARRSQLDDDADDPVTLLGPRRVPRSRRR